MAQQIIAPIELNLRMANAPQIGGDPNDILKNINNYVKNLIKANLIIDNNILKIIY